MFVEKANICGNISQLVLGGPSDVGLVIEPGVG